jgi:hypothetical protein
MAYQNPQYFANSPFNQLRSQGGFANPSNDPSIIASRFPSKDHRFDLEIPTQAKDPRSDLEKVVDKFYGHLFENGANTVLKTELENSRQTDGTTDFSEISLESLKLILSKFNNTSKSLTKQSDKIGFYYSIKPFILGISDKIKSREEQLEKLEEERLEFKTYLTTKLQNLTLYAIEQTLTSLNKIDTDDLFEASTDDLFGAIIPQGQTQDSQPSTDLKFNSKRAKDQISEFLIAEEKLADLSKDSEIQRFYFKKLQEIKLAKEQELKEKFLKDFREKLTNKDTSNTKQIKEAIKPKNNQSLLNLLTKNNILELGSESYNYFSSLDNEKQKEILQDFFTEVDEKSFRSFVSVKIFYAQTDKLTNFLTDIKDKTASKILDQFATDFHAQDSIKAHKQDLGDEKCAEIIKKSAELRCEKKLEGEKKLEEYVDELFDAHDFVYQKLSSSASIYAHDLQYFKSLATAVGEEKCKEIIKKSSEIERDYSKRYQIEPDSFDSSHFLSHSEETTDQKPPSPETQSKKPSQKPKPTHQTSQTSQNYIIKHFKEKCPLRSTSQGEKFLEFVEKEYQKYCTQFQKDQNLSFTKKITRLFKRDNLPKPREKLSYFDINKDNLLSTFKTAQDKEFRDLLKPRIIDKIRSSMSWFAESVKTLDLKTSNQDYEIITPAIKAFQKFGGNPDEASQFASFLNKKFNDEKSQNTSLTFKDFIGKQTVGQLLTEFNLRKSHTENPPVSASIGYPPRAISISRPRAGDPPANTQALSPSQQARKGDFLTPGKSNPNDTLIRELLGEHKLTTQNIWHSKKQSSKTTVRVLDGSYSKLTPNQQKIVEIYANFKTKMQKFNYNRYRFKPEVKDKIIADALQELYNSEIFKNARRNARNKNTTPLDKDLDFVGGLYQRISETPGFSHRKDYDTNGLHGQIQQILNRSVLAPTKQPFLAPINSPQRSR